MGELLYYDEEEEWNRALLLYDAVLKEISTKLEILNNEFKLASPIQPNRAYNIPYKNPLQALPAKFGSRAKN